MNRLEGQLAIDLEVHTRVTGTVRPEADGVETAPPEPAEAVPFVPPPGDRIVLEGAEAEARPRTSASVGARLFREAEHYARRIGESGGLDWLDDAEARQWLADFRIVRSHVPAVVDRLAGRGATDDGLHAELVERLVGKRAKPAYHEEVVPDFDELLDTSGLVSEELSAEPEDSEDGETAGNLAAARRTAGVTRGRVMIAVARTRCLDWRPGWRIALEHRFEEVPQ